MSYTINTHILEKLRDEFAQNQLPLDIQPDQMVAHGSKENVCQVVAKAGFCPIFLEQGEKIPFTIVPYQSPLPIISKDRLLALLAQRKYCSRGWVEDPEISWLSVNASRTFVHKALSACISKVVSKNVRGDYPAIEIGAGMGYFLAGQIGRAHV